MKRPFLWIFAVAGQLIALRRQALQLELRGQGCQPGPSQSWEPAGYLCGQFLSAAFLLSFSFSPVRVDVFRIRSWESPMYCFRW